MSDVIATRGDYRLVLAPDDYPEQPDHDGQGSVYFLDGHSTGVFYQQHKGAGRDLTSALTHAWQRFGDIGLVERYMRTAQDVVGFDFFDTRDGKFVNVVTADDLTEWGFTDIENYHSLTGHSDPSHGNLSDWRAYVDGDVWVYTVEKLTHWTSDDGETRDTWESVDSCGGLYGHFYAEDAALEALHSYAPEVTEPDPER